MNLQNVVNILSFTHIIHLGGQGICVDDFQEVVNFIFNIIDGPIEVNMLCVHLR